MSLLKDFRDFLMRGNILELAIAFVLGVAFAAVVNSLVKNVIMQIVAYIGDKPTFSDVTLGKLQIGAFLTDVVSFLLIAAAVFFLVVKPMLMFMARRERGEEPAVPPPSEEVVLLREIRDALRGPRST
jgi:large conductance mechanosensitive channel